MRTEGASEQGLRLLWIDVVRGAAIAGMIVYHLTWDLAFFRYVPAAVLRQPAFVLFGHSVAVSFLAVSGFSLALASRNGFNFGRYLRWLAKVAAAAALVTIATFFVFPDSYVTFGILHSIAAASLIAAFLIPLPWAIAAGFGAAIVAAGFAIALPAFDPVNGWLGLGVKIPRTNDWRPIFPWAGFVLLGLAAGKIYLGRGRLEKFSARTAPAAPARLTAFAGRHSLAIYLIHQPVLFGLVWSAAQIAPAQPAVTTYPETSFQQACVARCTKAGSPGDFCARACSCLIREAKASELWASIAAGRLTADQQMRYSDIVADCRAEAVKP